MTRYDTPRTLSWQQMSFSKTSSTGLRAYAVISVISACSHQSPLRETCPDHPY
jgi:hypothetical protein